MNKKFLGVCIKREGKFYLAQAAFQIDRKREFELIGKFRTMQDAEIACCEVNNTQPSNVKGARQIIYPRQSYKRISA